MIFRFLIPQVLEAGGYCGFIFLVTIVLLKSFNSLTRESEVFSVGLCDMFSIKMVTFCKSADCPSSQQLLAFQSGEDSLKERRRIKTHLAICEFCASEVEFYAHYPQSEEIVPKVEIPIPLYELAEALLGNKHKDFFALNKLLCEDKALRGKKWKKEKVKKLA
jgi:hypothetical protein